VTEWIRKIGSDFLWQLFDASGTSKVRWLDSAGTEVATLDSDGKAYLAGGVRTKVATTNVTDPPTDAELDTAFGAPATVGEGFVGIVDDNNAETTMWLVAAVGSTWWYVELTKAS